MRKEIRDLLDTDPFGTKTHSRVPYKGKGKIYTTSTQSRLNHINAAKNKATSYPEVRRKR